MRNRTVQTSRAAVQRAGLFRREWLFRFVALKAREKVGRGGFSQIQLGVERRRMRAESELPCLGRGTRICQARVRPKNFLGTLAAGRHAAYTVVLYSQAYERSAASLRSSATELNQQCCQDNADAALRLGKSFWNHRC